MVVKKVKKTEKDENVTDLIKGMNEGSIEDEKSSEKGEIPEFISEDECFYKLTESGILLRNLISGDSDRTNMENEALSDGIICVEMIKNNLLELYFKMMNQELHSREGENLEVEE